MLIAAVILSALALGVAGAALALAVAGMAGHQAPTLPQNREEAEEAERDALMREGIANLMNYAPQDGREGEI